MKVKDVALTLIEHSDSVFLLKRKYGPFRGYWAFPGGVREKGEDIKECALRETKEETGLEVQIIDQLDVFSHYDKKSNLLFKVHIFTCASSESTDYHLNGESSDGGWFNREMIAKRKLKLIPQLVKYLAYNP
ncbi:MAG: NUDIX hydrolase [Candidatus Pacearchaeota archaeon]|nr:NUDIX hydrolase [Candidatus Pacearchaeota archaeon]